MSIDYRALLAGASSAAAAPSVDPSRPLWVTRAPLATPAAAADKTDRPQPRAAALPAPPSTATRIAAASIALAPAVPEAAPAAAAVPAAAATPVAASPPAAATGSRRRRLWELSGHAHCPVIGVCLPLPALRRLLAKLDSHVAIEDDYELHCTMVSLAKRRGPLAEALQRELDRRYLLPLRSAARAKGEDELQHWWQEASAGDDLGAALWATLTHPQCTPALQDRVLGQVHMHQHQVGMVTRVELSRFEQLIDENAVLARELGRMQQRCTHQAAGFAQRSQQHEAELLRCRAALIGCRSELDQAQVQLATLQQADPDLATRQALAADKRELQERLLQTQRALQQTQQQLAQQQARQQDLEQRLRRHVSGADCAAGAVDGVGSVGSVGGFGAVGAAGSPDAGSTTAPPPLLQLNARAVLCVGGRLSSVPIYRRLIERVGGRFLHHDGGDEDSVHKLDATLAAADLVICQTGCISHGAYWRVKDHCKRTGKRCLFVEAPSRAALQRALADAALAALP